MKKKILFVHQTSSIGGGSYCLLGIIRELDKTVFEPYVALKTPGPLCDELSKLNIPVILFKEMTAIPYNGSLWKFRNVLLYIKVFFLRRKLNIILENIGIDVLYLNNMMLLGYLPVAKKLRIKTIMHVREHWPLDEHKIQLYFLRKIVDKNVDKIIAINKYSASIFPNQNATIVYDWIDMDSRYKHLPFNSIIPDYNNTMKVYLYLGGMSDIKGATQVLDLFTKKVVDQNSRLLVLGINPRIETVGAKSIIKKILSNLGYETYEYKVKNRISKDNRIICIPSEYNIKHIIEQSYCNLSFFTIPHANLALAECIILGVPSVCAKTEESLEYSHDGSFAVLYELGNEIEFAEALQYLENNYQKIKSQVQGGSEVIKNMFDKRKNIKLLLDTIKEV